MKIELVVALVAGAVALASAVLSIWGQSYSSRLAAQLEDLRQTENTRLLREKSVSRYREPLGHAAYDLQSRLYNILEKKLIPIYYDSGSDRERSYVLDNTVFLAAQYFAWDRNNPARHSILGTSAQTIKPVSCPSCRTRYIRYGKPMIMNLSFGSSPANNEPSENE